MVEHPTTVGIDVSKDHLDVATLPTGEVYRVTNNASGRATLIERLQALEDLDRIVLEATGGYERAPALALAEFARALRPPVRDLGTERQHVLEGPIHRRRQLVVMIGSERQRQAASRNARPPAATRSFARASTSSSRPSRANSAAGNANCCAPSKPTQDGAIGSSSCRPCPASGSSLPSRSLRSSANSGA